MHVDDQNHQFAGFQTLVHFLAQGAIVVAVVEVVFHHLIGVDQLTELLLGAVVVIHTFLLPGAGAAGGGRHGFFDLRMGLAQCLDHAVLTGAGGTGHNKQKFILLHGSVPPLLFPCSPARPHGLPPFPAEGPRAPHDRNP